MKVSYMAQNLIPSEIIKIAGIVNDRIANGEKLCNLTIGDFNPEYFPVPDEYKEAIIKAYKNNHTNYPAANGIEPLRKQVSAFFKKRQKLDYSPDEILISGGARPLIFGAYAVLIDKNDKVVYPIPSWNNNHYCHITGAKGIPIETKPENNFLPVAGDLKKQLQDAVLLALCSPLNPTGTSFNKDALKEICRIVLEINKKRDLTKQKPIYILYDQIYWMLCHGGVIHYSPVELFPELRPYTIYIDGMSKAFSATGVRVGWAFGPVEIISKMRAILSHLGAWAPKAEQVATAEFLKNDTAIDKFIHSFKQKLSARLFVLYNGLNDLKKIGFPVDVISPMASIYLTAQFNLIGCKTKDGKEIKDSIDITDYLLTEAGFAIVPFYAFGAEKESTWFRLSVGAVSMEEIKHVLTKLKMALEKIMLPLIPISDLSMKH